jgi:hypothetical protein
MDRLTNLITLFFGQFNKPVKEHPIDILTQCIEKNCAKIIVEYIETTLFEKINIYFSTHKFLKTYAHGHTIELFLIGRFPLTKPDAPMFFEFHCYRFDGWGGYNKPYEITDAQLTSALNDGKKLIIRYKYGLHVSDSYITKLDAEVRAAIIAHLEDSVNSH